MTWTVPEGERRMDPLFSDSVDWLPGAHEPPCLSLYQPTHRHYPENKRDPIAFRNLVKELEQSLARKYPARDIEPLLEPFNAMAADEEFWNYTLDGLAVLGAPGFFKVYKLQQPVNGLVVVADSFHIKPLMLSLQSADRFQVLCLTRKQIRLFEGNRDTLDEVELAPGIPRTIVDALGDEHTEPHLTVASYGKGAAGPAMRHGQGSRKDELDKDAERFFRAVDRAITEYYSKPSGLELMLAALPEYHTPFRNISHNPLLMDFGIEVNPEPLSGEELGRLAWEALEPHYVKRIDALVGEFQEAKSKGLAVDELAAVAEAVFAGRVATLMIDADREVPGRIDMDSGSVEYDELDDPEVDDLLDDLGEMVLQKGGKVLVVPSERMPTESGAAAIFRY
jgi:hypothetical protein